MPIKVEKDYPVYTVIIDNPEVKNAVDRVSSQHLANAFKEFEQDKNALVAVLWGERTLSRYRFSNRQSFNSKTNMT